MDYQTFIEKLNEEELVKTIENALGYNVDVFVHVGKDTSVPNRFDVVVTLVVEKMHKFYNSEEKYRFTVDLDYNNAYEDTEVSIPLDKDMMKRIVEMSEAIDQYFMNVFEGEGE